MRTWIVDPDADTVEVYRLPENRSAALQTFAAADTLTTALLPGFSIPLRDIFPA